MPTRTSFTGSSPELPPLIQGGMGVGVSGWRLARAVASLGQLGVVSGTALDTILIRRLAARHDQDELARALTAFPIPGVVDRVLARYGPDVREAADPFALASMPRAVMAPERLALIVLANFVEVYLAKSGHGGPVGINYLHKIQFPILPSLYGAMLAGVDVVLMGAGIPGEIPAVLDRLAAHEPARVELDVLDAGEDRYYAEFDPRGQLGEWWGGGLPPAIHRPAFLAIVSSATLARALLKKAPGGIQGFVVEAPIAGGHNAPPRGSPPLSVRGEPVYGVRDEFDLPQLRALGVPFWLAGGYASPRRFAEAIDAGARGIQVGTAFAFCEESGLEPGLRTRFLESVASGTADVFTDPAASPTSFPFKVASLPGTLSEPSIYSERGRVCDLGYLRRAYRKPDGTLGYRCPSEPLEDYVAKGGTPEETVGRKCLCNALLANVGLPQRRTNDSTEPALLTAGNDLECLKAFLHDGRTSYHADEVVRWLVPNAQETVAASA